MNRLFPVAAVLAFALLIFAPLHAQSASVITPANANQLTELGRESFYLEPALAPDALALSPDGQTLAIGTLQGMFLTDIGAFLRSGGVAGLMGTDATVLNWGFQFQRPTFSPDGRWLLALEGVQWQPGTLYIWDLETLDRSFGPHIPPGHYQSFAFRPGTDEVYYSYFVDPVRFTDPESIIPTGALQYFYLEAPGSVSFYYIEEANRQFFVRGFNPTGSQMHYTVHDLNTNETSHHFWDFEANAEIEPIFTGSADAILSPDWTTAVELDSSADPAFFLHDLNAGSTTRVTVEADTLSRALFFSPDSQLIVGSTFTGDIVSLRLWDASNGAEVAVIPLGEFDVLEVLFTADMTRLIARIVRSMPLTPEADQLVVWSIS